MSQAPYPAVLRFGLTRHVMTVLWCLGIYFIVAFAISVFGRFHYPFELDLIEGGMLEQVNHVARGLPLYAEPSLDFIAFIYGPFFTYFAALCGKLLGYGFENLRLISIASTIASCAAIALLVFQATKRTTLAFSGCALFLATYAAAGFSFDQGRVDSLFLALLLWAYYFLRYGKARREMILAAILFACAFFTKQIAIIPILCLVPFLSRKSADNFFVFTVALVCFGVSGFVALDWIFDGWYSYYCFTLPAHHDVRVAMYRHFWLSDVLMTLPFGVFLLGFGLRSTKRDGEKERFLGEICFVTGFVLLSWVSRLHSGGIENVLAPAYAALAITAASAVQNFKNVGAGYAAVAVQLLWLLYFPMNGIPSVRDSEAGYKLVDTIRQVSGDIYIPYHPYLLPMAGKKSHAHHWAFYDVLRGDPEGQGAKLRSEFFAALASRRFTTILTDDDWMKAEIESIYTSKGNVFEDADTFRPVFGETRSRPERWYERLQE